MDVILITKDWKESWAFYSKEIEKIKKIGYIYFSEHNGEEFGIDCDFLVFSNDKEVKKASEEIVKAVFFEANDEELEEDSITEYYKEEAEKVIIKTKDGKMFNVMKMPV